MQVLDKVARGELVTLAHALKATCEIEGFLNHGLLRTASYTKTETPEKRTGYNGTADREN